MQHYLAKLDMQFLKIRRQDRSFYLVILLKDSSKINFKCQYILTDVILSASIFSVLSYVHVFIC